MKTINCPFCQNTHTQTDIITCNFCNAKFSIPNKKSKVIFLQKNYILIFAKTRKLKDLIKISNVSIFDKSKQIEAEINDFCISDYNEALLKFKNIHEMCCFI